MRSLAWLILETRIGWTIQVSLFSSDRKRRCKNKDVLIRTFTFLWKKSWKTKMWLYQARKRLSTSHKLSHNYQPLDCKTILPSCQISKTQKSRWTLAITVKICTEFTVLAKTSKANSNLLPKVFRKKDRVVRSNEPIRMLLSQWWTLNRCNLG